jgi:hypothetical protein
VVYTTLGLPGDDFVGILTYSVTLLFCVLAVSHNRLTFRIGLVWGISSMASAPLAAIFGIWSIALIYLSFILYTTAVIIHSVIVSREISINTIFGSIAGFLLMGVLGGIVCQQLWQSNPGSFTISGTMGDPEIGFFYYSIITMTSLGYGDITPASDLARMVSAYLVLAGQLYLTIQVAILVGKFIKGSDTAMDDSRVIRDLRAEVRRLRSRIDPRQEE